MSEPRHIWASEYEMGRNAGRWTTQPPLQTPPESARHTLTEGEEWTALMERARDRLGAPGVEPNWSADPHTILRDILTYLGEQP